MPGVGHDGQTLSIVQPQQLAYFVAVAEMRHFTNAAESPGITRPSLSKQVRALEDDLTLEAYLAEAAASGALPRRSRAARTALNPEARGENHSLGGRTAG